MTEREYNQANGVRRSALWHMRESPEKYKYFLENPEPQTPALLFGAAVHKMLLEPDKFFDEYAVLPNVDRRTKAGKEEYERFLETLGERTAITQDDYTTAYDMTSKARSVPMVEKLLKGEHEKSIFWTDEDTGIKCKVRLDLLTEIDGRFVVADYKSANNAKTEIFNNKMFDFGYHLQAYMYTEAVMKELKLDYRPDFIFIAQEKKAPFALNLILVTEDVMTAGMDAFRLYMGMLHYCEQTGYWYGYNGPFDEVNESFLPGWMTMGEEETE